MAYEDQALLEEQEAALNELLRRNIATPECWEMLS